MNTVRIELDEEIDLAHLHRWLTRHRGRVVAVDAGRRLALGVPISGARAVIVAVVLQDDHGTGPKLGGVVRALSHRAKAEPVRLVFEGRARAGVTVDEAEATARELLGAISRLALTAAPVEEVA